jgi:hypothetical protein
MVNDNQLSFDCHCASMGLSTACKGLGVDGTAAQLRSRDAAVAAKEYGQQHICLSV